MIVNLEFYIDYSYWWNTLCSNILDVFNRNMIDLSKYRFC